jgi:hypothetical protein
MDMRQQFPVRNFLIATTFSGKGILRLYDGFNVTRRRVLLKQDLLFDFKKWGESRKKKKGNHFMVALPY